MEGIAFAIVIVVAWLIFSVIWGDKPMNDVFTKDIKQNTHDKDNQKGKDNR